MISNAIGLFFRPKRQWKTIGAGSFSLASALIYVAVLALLPCVSWYYGITQVGWTVGEGDPIRLTAASAQVIIVLFYCAMLISICVIGYMIHWMAHTYGADSSTAKGITITGFAATPLFVVSIVGFIPIVWLHLLLGIVAVCYAVYLLYLGIPIVMQIPKERGFLFSSAVLAVCLVIIIVIMVGSVILWDFGAAPRFTD